MARWIGGFGASCALVFLMEGCGPQPSPPTQADTIVAQAKAREAVWKVEHTKREAAEAAAARAEWENAPDCKPSPFEFIHNDMLSITEFHSFGSDQTGRPLTVAGQARPLRLGYRAFDYEAYPLRGKWAGVGLIYVRADPADRRTVGGVLWTRTDELPSGGGGTFVTRQDGEMLTVSLVPRYSDEAGTKIACISRFRMRLDKAGVLYADGRQVGVFR